MTSDRQIRQAALDAESRSGTIGHALARYREARGWSRDELAAWLGVTVDGLAAISVELVPPPVLTYLLADRYSIDQGRLHEALE